VRTYIKAYQSTIQMRGAPMLQWTEHEVEGSQLVFVQMNVGLKQFHLAWLNLAADMSNEWETQPFLSRDPLHTLDFTLIGPYAQHPLN